MAQARSLRRVHDAWTSGSEVHGLRAVVEQSWARSDQAGVLAEGHLAPIVMDEHAIADRWETHPLYPVLPVLRSLLTDATTRAGHMMVISDARGVLLWIEGHQRVLEATEGMHFVCGADWSETGAGTNALGTAIAVDHPVQIFSAEHFNRAVHPWQCSGAPIHDPRTGEIVGVIDLTGHLRTAHPHTLSLVTAAARMAEAYLTSEHERRAERLRERFCARVAGASQSTALLDDDGHVLMAIPHGWVSGRVDVQAPEGFHTVVGRGIRASAEPLAGGGFVLWREGTVDPVVVPAPAAPHAELELELLSSRPQARIGTKVIPLSLRHAELLTVLALSPRGLTGEQLALELYGERGRPVTVRAEVSRLRRMLGDAVSARPYRLTVPVRSDVAEVERLIAARRVPEALAAYDDVVLPGSDVPLVVEWRQRVDAALRSTAMASADTGLLSAWCATASGRDDQPAAELLLSLLPPDDAARAAAQARVDRIRRQHDDGDVVPAW